MPYEINIPSSTPMIYDLGTDDQSKRVVPTLPLKNRVVPLFCIYAARGSTKRHYIAGNASTVFGDATFDPAGPYYNHQTDSALACAANGNMVSYQRIVPDDAKTAVLYLELELKQGTIPKYLRDSKGKYIIDGSTGRPIEDGTTDGYIYAWRLADGTESYDELLIKGRAGVRTETTVAPDALVSGTEIPANDAVLFDDDVWQNGGAAYTPIEEVKPIEMSDLGWNIIEPNVSGDVSPGEYIITQANEAMYNDSNVVITVSPLDDRAAMESAGLVYKSDVAEANTLSGSQAADTVTYDVGSDTYYANLTGGAIDIAVAVIDSYVLTSHGMMNKGPFVPGDVTIYPYMLLGFNGEGEAGNNTGVRLFAQSVPGDLNVANEQRFIFGLEQVERADRYATAETIPTKLGNLVVTFSTEPGATDSLMNSLDLADLLRDSYANTTDPSLPMTEPHFSDVEVFQDSINEALLLIAETEKAATTEYWSDFHVGDNTNRTADDLKYVSNFVNARHSSGAPYVSFVSSLIGDSFQLGRYNTVYAMGGSDGTLDLAAFEQAVSDLMDEYADIESPVQDDAAYFETDFYDTGFNLDTKLNLHKFASIRKDLSVLYSTYEFDARIKTGGASNPMYQVGDVQTRSEELAIASLIRTRLKLIPDSVEFNTPAFRPVIVAGSGRRRNSQWKQRAPLSIWLIDRISKYMSSGTGVWQSDEAFDIAPGHIVDNMYDLSSSWVSNTVAQRLWSLGINYHKTFDQTGLSYVPALRSVYDNETSVLSSLYAGKITQAVTRVVHQAVRRYQGNVRMTPAQLARAINEFIDQELADAFDGMAKIVPEAQLSDLDVLRGYSLTIPVRIYMNGMITSFPFYITVDRMSAMTNG